MFILFSRVFGGTINNMRNNQINSTNVKVNERTSSPHIFNLDRSKPQFYNTSGRRTIVNFDNFPILAGMGALLLSLAKGGVSEPQWHINADQLGYFITDNTMMTIYGTNASTDIFAMNSGQLTFLFPGSTCIILKMWVMERSNLSFYMIMNDENPVHL